MSPGVHLPMDGNQIAAQLRNIEKALAALQTQQLIIISDTNNTERIRLGLLKSGEVGLAVTDVNGHGNELLPIYSDQLFGLVGTSSASYVDLGFPAIAAVVGVSGKVAVTVSSSVTTATLGASTAEAGCSVYVDGSLASSAVLQNIITQEIVTTGALTLGATNAATVIATGLSPGSHTFKVMFAALQGTQQAKFQTTYMQVEPI